MIKLITMQLGLHYETCVIPVNMEVRNHFALLCAKEATEFYKEWVHNGSFTILLRHKSLNYLHNVAHYRVTTSNHNGY